MKTISTLFLAIVLSTTMAFSQGNDTLLFMDFNDSTIVATDIIVGPPSGNDITWINFDADQNNDANSRPPEWYWSPEGFATDDTTGVMIANSWFSPFAVSDNWLITPAIEIIDNTAQLFWKSAPYQTPLYLDGYQVLVSTTDNIETSFTDTLMLFAEYIAGTGTPSAGWTNYTFSPGYVHGINGMYIEFDPTADSSRFLGVLEPHSVSLAQYAGQTIYIAFRHHSDDDNLISIDDVLVTGTLNTGITETSNLASLGVYPNPASDNVQVTYELRTTTPMVSTLYDATGKKVKEIARSQQMAGKHHFNLNVQNLSSGTYFIELKTPMGSITQKLVVE